MSLTSRKTKIAAPAAPNPRRGRAPMLGRRRPRAAAGTAAPSPAPDAQDADGVDLTGLMSEEGIDEVPAAPVERRKRYDDDKSTFLGKYFRDMAALEVMPAEHEFTCARELELLELQVWQTLLSYPQSLEHVLALVETCLDNSLAEFRTLRKLAATARRTSTKANVAKLEKAAARVAPKLRSLDTDRQTMEQVLGEIERLRRGLPGRVGGDRPVLSIGGPAARAWMGRVASAERAAAASRNAFVLANLRLVVSIARRFNHGRMALADLIQEGNIGLMKAVERYDYRRGFRFSTYASWWIRHAISRALADKGREVRLPVHMIDAYHRIARARRELAAKLGRNATTEELAQATQIAPGKIEKMRTYLIDGSMSLDKPVSDEDGRQFIEFLHDPSYDEAAPAERMTLEAQTEELRGLLDDLKPIEADILRQRFGLDDDRELTLKEIGEKYNLSRERIRQLQEQALTKIRRALVRPEE
ncbi:MAG TPA: sigma-70 family RNA polymerase sigma factor [Kofleriaceae bacterium]|nr:sigma-70 family RNA polymerase sigma factor [Kofleriaceae bacterium]